MKAGNVRKGMYISRHGQPFLVAETEFSFVGRGSAHMKMKLKKLDGSGSVSATYKSNESVEELDVTNVEMQFLYIDGDEVVFMDQQSFEQSSVPLSLLDGKEKLLTVETKTYVQLLNDKAVGVSLPPKVKLKVTDAPDATAGNRSKAAKRDVTLETGLVVQAPLFIKNGDVLIIDTNSGEYVSRG